MVIRRTTYPQVEPRAADLMTRAVTVVPPSLAVEEAARLARRRGARLLVARARGRWGGVVPATLEHALGLGLQRLAVEALLWEAGSVGPAAREVAVRRRLGPGAPFVVVVAGGRPVGAVLAGPRSGAPLSRSLAAALGRLPSETAGVLRAAGELGDARGWAVVAVGGFVRDLLIGAALSAADLDLAVEGEARTLAGRLAERLGGRVVEHESFLTATLVLASGRRVDVATARRERYPRPGALPKVEAATLAEDLARRDFTVNALAVCLDGVRWGQVLDPCGGGADLRQRRIRVLHPLSFIEDPTRIFRAVRLAVRLGFRLDRTTRGLAAAAAALPVYEALSGDRLRAELGAILREREPAAVLAELGKVGAFRLLTPGYRFPAATPRLLARVAARTRGLRLGPKTAEGLYVQALTAHLGDDAADACAERLGLPPAVRAGIRRARTGAGPLLAALALATEPDRAYRVLRPLPELTVAWANVMARRATAWRWIREHLGRWRDLKPLLGGDDLRAMGLPPGPRLGRLLDGLLAAQAAGLVTDRAGAARWVERGVAQETEVAGDRSRRRRERGD